MRKFLLGLVLMLGLVSAAPANAHGWGRRVVVPVYPVYPIYPVMPVRPCVYRLVPVTTLQAVYTIYGVQYQYVTTYAYQLVCY